MFLARLVAGSLARRFALSAAALAAAALLMTLLASWALVAQQHAAGMQALQAREMDFHAASARGALRAIATRMSDVAESEILANALLDGAGRETYLKPYLNGARQVNGVPVQLVLTDFEGRALAETSGATFTAAHLAWLRQQLERTGDAATVMDGPDGPELLAVRLLHDARAGPPEGALLYKVRLASIAGESDSGLVVVAGPHQAAPGVELRRISAPPAYAALDLQLLRNKTPPVDYSALLPHYALILIVVLALAAAVLLLGARLALALTRDLRRLEGFSSSVVRDGLGLRRADVRGSREVASLAHSINHMLDRLHQQHAQLQNESEKFHQLANTIPQMAWIASASGAVEWYNDRWYAYTGLDPGQAAGDGWRRMIDAAEVPAVEKQWRAGIASGAPFSMTIKMRGADGQARRLLTQLAPLYDAGGRLVQWFGTSTDLSPLEQAEQALLLADQRKDEFLAMLAHELRNPLAPISSAVRIMELVSPDAPPQVKKAREVIDRQIRHLSRLVDDLMDVSRISTGKIVLRDEQVDAAVVVLRAIEMNRPLLDARGHHLHVRGLDAPQMLRGDSTRLTQVVGNLINNAAKYTEAGGDITVGLAREGDWLVIRVADNGVGMSPQIVPHVFNLFLQAERSLDRSLGGLGIGLSVVRRLTELHGGAVEAHSAGERMGSEFVIRLPASSTPLPADADADVRGAAGTGARRILVVDDNRDAVDALAMMLKLNGNDVEAAYDGVSALGTAQSFQPDAVVLDIGLPGMDGYEVARRLRARPESAAMLIVAVTGYGHMEDRERAHAAGFDHHLVKPIESETLLKLLGGGSSGSH